MNKTIQKTILLFFALFVWLVNLTLAQVPPNPTCGTTINLLGTNNFVNIQPHTSLNFNSQFSITGWIKTSYTGEQYILSKGSNSLILGTGVENNGGNLSVYLNGVSTSWTHSNIFVADNNWHFIAVTWNGTDLTYYVDGNNGGMGYLPGTLTTGNNPFQIGQHLGNGQFQGALDEFSVFDTTLDIAQITYIENHILSGSEPRLVASWSFNEKNGNSITDNSPNANNGTIQNYNKAVWQQPDGTPPCVGGVLDFDGINDVAILPDNPKTRLYQNFTIEFWMKAKTNSMGGQYIISRNGAGGQYAVIYEFEDNTIEFYGDQGINGLKPRPYSKITIADTLWHHIAYTYNGNNFRGFKDGVMVCNQAMYFYLLPLAGTNWFLGAANNLGTSSPANVKLDEVRIWNRAVCEDELINNMHGTLTGLEDGLMAYYPFNEGVANGNNIGTNIVHDFGPNAIHGSLSNMALNGNTSNWVFDKIDTPAPKYIPPAISITASDTGFCVGTTANLTVTTGFSSYSWSTGFVTSANTVSYTPTTTTTLSVTGTTSKECKTTASQKLYVFGTGVSNVELENDTVKCSTLSPGATYTWVNCSANNTVLPNDTLSYIKGSLGNSYSVIIDDNGCKDTSACFSVNKAGALDFDGTNDLLTVADNANLRLSNQFTIECWIKLNTTGQTNKYLVTRNSNNGQWAIIYGYKLNTFELFAMNGSDGDNPGSGSEIVVNDTSWHHLCYTYDGNYLTGLLDGNSVFSIYKKFTFRQLVGNNLFIGGNGVGSGLMNIKLDEFRIWNRGLCRGEILFHKDCQLNGNENGLVAYYDFNQGYINSKNSLNQTVTDRSNHLNTASMSGFNLSGLSSNWVTEKITGNCGNYTGIPIGISASKSLICLGNSINISASAGFTNYSWNTNNTQSSFSLTPLSGIILTVNATDSLGCNATGSKSIIVSQPTLSLAAPVNPVCYGDSVNLTASGTFMDCNWNNGKDTSIIKELPTSTSYYTATVSDSIGCTVTDSILVSVSHPSAAISTNRLVACNNEIIRLTASAGYDFYFWNTGNNTDTISVTITADTLLSVQITDSVGCQATDSIAIRRSIPLAEITSTTDIICYGDSLLLTAPIGYSGYNWNNNSVNDSTMVMPTSTTTYILQITDSLGCIASAQKEITVSYPFVSIAGPQQTICKGSANTLSATTGYTSYLWSNGEQTSSINVYPWQNTTYTLSVTDSIGCVTTESYTILVSAPQPGITVSQDTVCIGQTTMLYANPGYISYSWSTGSADTSITIQPDSTNYYILEVTDTLGCTASTREWVYVSIAQNSINTAKLLICKGETATLNSAGNFNSYTWNTGETSSSIQVSPDSTLHYDLIVTNYLGCIDTSSIMLMVSKPFVEITPSQTNICLGNTATLTATTGHLQYSWSNAANTNTISVTPLETTTYTVYITDSVGCETQTSATVFTQQPSVSLTAGSTQLCWGNSTTLNATSGFTTYTWSFAGVSNNTLTVQPDSSTNYTVTVNDQLGCKATASITINVIKLNTNILEQNATLICQEPSAQYQWVDCNTNLLLSGETNQQITPPANGNFGVIIEKNGCKDTSNCYNFVVISVKEENNQTNIGIYPNPGQGNVWVENNLSSDKSASIVITDVNGKVVLQKSITNNSRELVLHQGELSSGIYIYKILIDNSVTKTNKLVITQ